MADPHRPILGPTALHLKSVLSVTEQLGFWLKGKLVKNDHVFVELSFEQSGHHQHNFPGTPFTYILLYRNRQTLFEFQLGRVLYSTPEAAAYVYDLATAIKGHSPVAITDRPNEDTINRRKSEYHKKMILMRRGPSK